MTQYIVVAEYDSYKNYGTKIRKQYANILSTLKKDQKITPAEFTKAHLNQFTRKKSLKTIKGAVYHSLSLGNKLGLLRRLNHEEIGLPISYERFCQLDSVKYFISQLRQSRYKNIKNDNAGTAFTYSRHLWNFNNWLHGKEFEFERIIPTGNATFKKERPKIKLEGVEHFFRLYEESYTSKHDFVRMVKRYLLDPSHKNNKPSYMKIKYNAIKSYFEKNEFPLEFKLDFNAIQDSDEAEQPLMTLKDVLELLTVGKPSLLQKAVFLCKFHRGLDNSTLVEKFNFEAWSQLVDYFGTEDYEKWELKECLVPIKLTRMKQNYTHTGFLDVDAVQAIQDYLRYRRKQILPEMRKGKPLFLNQQRKPITNDWVKSSFAKLRKNACLDKTLSGYNQKRYKINPHEFRDLLVSTLIECGVRTDLVEHFIGDKPKGSYRKQTEIFPATLKKEFSKASKMLNIFSNISNYMNGENDLANKVKELERRLSEEERKTEWVSYQALLSAGPPYFGAP